MVAQTPDNGPRLLIADDDPAVLKSFSMALERVLNRAGLQDLEDQLFHPTSKNPNPTRAQYRITYVQQGAEAIEAVEQSLQEHDPFAVAFLDVRMPPGIDGVETAERLRSLDPAINLCIVTGYTDVDPEDIALRVAPADKLFFVQKPFHAREIRQFAAALSARWVAEHQLLELQHNLEERVQQQAQHLARAQKLESIGTLASGIAHDFNNVLYAIIGFSEFAIEERQDPDKVEAHLQEVLTAAHRAGDLVDQILSFSRSEEDKLRPTLLQPAIKETLKLLRKTLPAHIHIQQHIDPDCPPILSDPTRLHQILMNLCTNAWQAMPDGGQLRISITQEQPRAEALLLGGKPESPCVRLSVSDTGYGMESSILEHIFDPYFTTKGPSRGTGLGLATVLGIVRSAGGGIQVESQPGKGTSFHIFFPRASDTPKPQNPPEQSPPALQCAHGTVLLVEDEDSLRRMGAMALTAFGFSVDTASNAEEALIHLNQNNMGIDVLITDLTMPGMNGSKLAEHAKQLRPERPVILLSGFYDESKEPCPAVDTVLKKPLSPKNLVQAVQRLLARHQNTAPH